MSTHQISYRELATLPKFVDPITAFQAILSVIPDSGCRLFVNYQRQCIPVVDDEGGPMYFPSVECALSELAMLPAIDQQVIVDIISLLPRVVTRHRIFDGTGKMLSRLLGSRSATTFSRST